MLDVIKIGLINARLNISASLDTPNEIVHQDIYLRAKMEIIEDLLEYDKTQTELARERQAKSPKE